MNNEMYLTIEEAAALTRFSKSSLYTYVNQRRMPFIKREGKLLFKQSELIKWLDNGTVAPISPIKLGGVTIRL